MHNGNRKTGVVIIATSLFAMLIVVGLLGRQSGSPSNRPSNAGEWDNGTFRRFILRSMIRGAQAAIDCKNLAICLLLVL